ncbi:MAG TPA: NAD(P)H-binding protein [Dehalococcoidia bacterium]|nr:NAD(P)H-binding protein [Dehalococcoidia bacterium]
MSRVLVTGGTGGLGAELVPRLKAAGHTVRVGSRKHAPAELEQGIEWAQMNLHPAEGIAEAIAGVDVVMHAASSPFKKTQETDVEGTKKLLKAARDTGVENFYYISIVGVDKIPENAYYRAKWAAEQAIEASGVPYTILRATQFHSLLDVFLRQLFKRGPLLFVPRAAKFQLIDTSEVAQHMADTLAKSGAGRLEDIGGPEVLTAGDIADSWVRASGTCVLKVPVPAVGPMKPFAEGRNTCPEQKFGHTTWPEWLERTYKRS